MEELGRGRGDAEQLPPRPRPHLCAARCAVSYRRQQPREQRGFRSATAVAVAQGPVNEAADAAELRDSPEGRAHPRPGHAPSPDWCLSRATPTEAGRRGGVTTRPGSWRLLSPSHLLEPYHQGPRRQEMALPSFLPQLPLPPGWMLGTEPGLVKESHLNSHNWWGKETEAPTKCGSLGQEVGTEFLCLYPLIYQDLA